MATVSDILRNADAFRRAYPNWPHAEPRPVCWECRVNSGRHCRCAELASAAEDYRRGRQAGYADRLAGRWEQPESTCYGHGYDRGWWDAEIEINPEG
jgi:hypothetical protein